MEDTKIHIATVPTLSPVWTTNITAWFYYAENEFEALNIREQRLKFQTVLRCLTRELYEEVTPVMVDHTTPNPYDLLKEALGKRLTLSDRQRADELFRGIELAGSKPTQLLRKMRQLLNGQQFDERFLKQLFLQRLPQQVQTALAACRAASLEELAENADAVMEAYGTPIATVQAPTPSTSHDQVTLETITKLFHEVMQIKEEWRGRTNFRGNGRGGFRSRSRRRYPARSPSRDSGMCWYHQTFGAEARSCRKPCSFSGTPKN